MKFRQRITTLLLVVMLCLSFSEVVSAKGSSHRSGGDVYVHGYTRKDGTYVKPHYRSAPDGYKTNNFSYCGNTNPYTGAIGTEDCNGTTTNSQSPIVTPNQTFNDIKQLQDNLKAQELKQVEVQNKLEQEKKLEQQRVLEETLKKQQLQDNLKALELKRVEEQKKLEKQQALEKSKQDQQITTEFFRKSVRNNSNSSYTPANVKVYLNNNILSFEQEPVIVDGSTLVPLRAIVESLGANVTWDAETQVITAIKDGTTIKLQIGNQNAYLNSASKVIDTAPLLVNGSTMIPMRFVSESFGAKVNWNQDTRTILIDK